MIIRKNEARNSGPIRLSTVSPGAMINPCMPILSSLLTPIFWVASKLVGFWLSGKEEARRVSLPSVKSIKCRLYIPSARRKVDHRLSVFSMFTGEIPLIACQIPLNAILIMGVFSGL